ncbi:MAG: metalloregulator ArsR/SmtB family transcription factor [Anaerolineales bacterium]|jgi:ArsR family transcriptional regulator
MSTIKDIRKVSRILRVVGQPDRIEILLVIGEGEACVCHLKAVLGKRQAFISQHLKALREAKVLETRREGRYIFYRAADKGVFDLIGLAGELAEVREGALSPAQAGGKVRGCECPQCASEGNPQLVKVEEINIR